MVFSRWLILQISILSEWNWKVIRDGRRGARWHKSFTITLDFSFKLTLLIWRIEGPFPNFISLVGVIIRIKWIENEIRYAIRYAIREREQSKRCNWGKWTSNIHSLFLHAQRKILLTLVTHKQKYFHEKLVVN